MTPLWNSLFVNLAAQSGYGTNKTRLGKDSVGDFDCCCLTLQPCANPVITYVLYIPYSQRSAHIHAHLLSAILCVKKTRKMAIRRCACIYAAGCTCRAYCPKGWLVYTPGWREAIIGKVSCLRTQVSWLGFEPTPRWLKGSGHYY